MPDDTTAAPTKRKKPIYRTRNLVLLVLTAFLAWLVFEIIYAYTATGGTGQAGWAAWNASQNEVASIAPDFETRTAADSLREASGLFSSVAAPRDEALGDISQFDDDRYFIFRNNLNSVAAAAHPTAPVELRQHHERILRDYLETDVQAIIDEAKAAEFHFPPQDQTGMVMSILLPNLGFARQFARAEAPAMRAAAHTGDWDQALLHFDNLLFAAEFPGRRPVLIGRLVTLAVEALAMIEVRYLLTESGPFPMETLDQMSSKMREYIGKRHPASLYYHAERTWVMDVIDQFHTGEPGGDGRFLLGNYLLLFQPSLTGNTPPPEAITKLANIGGLVLRGRRFNEQLADRYYNHTVELAEAPPHQTWLYLQPDERMLKDGTVPPPVLPNGVAEAINETEVSQQSLIIRDILPVISSALVSDIQASRNLAATLTLIETERFRRLEARIPTTIAEIEQHLGITLPPDAITGKPYRIITDPAVLAKDPANRPYLLIPDDGNPPAFFLDIGGAARDPIANAARPDWN